MIHKKLLGKGLGTVPTSAAAVLQLLQRSAPANADLHTQVSRRAYELYLARNCEDGHDLEDWLQAEREVGAAPQTRRSTRTRMTPLSAR